MTRLRAAPAVAVSLIALPLLWIAGDAASFHVGNRHTHALVSSGETREYVLHVPPAYDPRTPTPLVISLHGAGLWGAVHQRISQWDAVADREGFIVVYPSGPAGNGPRVWGLGASRLAREARFIADLIDTLSAEYNIDAARVYANGHSNGGAMSFVLSCAMPDRIAAVGLVGAALLLPWESCVDRRPVPVIAFHGTADPAAPYHGGSSWVTSRPFAGVRRWMHTWAERNRCAPEPTDTLFARGITRRAYAHCADEAAVVLYTIHGGGHDWPGGPPLPHWLSGPRSVGVDASSEMWRFFRDRRLRAAR